MISDNQILKISGCIGYGDELDFALEFALKASSYLERMESYNVKCVYQVTNDGKYCIGWSYGKVAEGWKEYAFGFDLSKVSLEISRFLEYQKLVKDPFGRISRKGFIMMLIHEKSNVECNGIKNPLYGIVEFRPYTCFYNRK